MVRDALDDFYVGLPGRSVGKDLWRGANGVWDPPPHGKILWVHRIPVFRPASGRTTVSWPVEEQFPIRYDERLRYERGEDRMLIVPGIGSSVVFVESGSVPFVADRFGNVIRLQNAYWAASQEFGFAILRETIGLAHFRKTRNVKSVLDEGLRIMELHHEVARFRSLSLRARDAPPSLGARPAGTDRPSLEARRGDEADGDPPGRSREPR